MSTPESGKSLDQLKARLEEVTQKITILEGLGTKNDEWNNLHNEHEALTAQIQDMESSHLEEAA